MELRTTLVALLATLTALGLVAPAADAARRPSSGEAAAIKEVALRACLASAPDECRYGRGRVSTRNARFAWATVTGEGFSGVLLRRPTPRSHRFRVIGRQGGGLGSCSYWRSRAPAPVLRDLRVVGVVDASGTVVNCGN